MKVTVKITRSFKTAAKPLLKKYQSLSKDLLNLEKDLVKTPRLGTPLGKDTYKIRLKITSKGKGKSGGARVISLVETVLIGYAQIVSDEEITVNLITIYDKADVDNISDKELKDLIQNFKP
ncbi:MAG TPA: addiction module toxin RelE [Ferruginibacter sp.]|nr:addiction module toxin RelE [Ferruginibacter sp.]HMP19367.1 addiction module toxin RelE [Ferruginibacter sp.]